MLTKPTVRVALISVVVYRPEPSSDIQSLRANSRDEARQRRKSRVGEVRDRTVREPEPRPFVAPLFTLAATVLIEPSRSARALVVGFRHRSHLLNIKSIGLEALNMPDTAPNDQKSVDGLSAVSKVRSISLPSSVLLPPIRSGGPSGDRAERNIRPTASCLLGKNLHNCGKQ